MASRVTWGSSTRLSANTTPSFGSSPVAGCASATAARQAASTSTPKPAPSPVVMSAVSDANSASVRESSRKPSTEDTSAAEEVPMTWTPGKAARTAATSDASKVS